jgi:hypothetical protein
MARASTSRSLSSLKFRIGPPLLQAAMMPGGPGTINAASQ